MGKKNTTIVLEKVKPITENIFFGFVVMFFCGVLSLNAQCKTQFSWQGTGVGNQMNWNSGQNSGSTTITSCTTNVIVNVSVDDTNNVWYNGTESSGGSTTNGSLGSQGLTVWLDNDENLFNQSGMTINEEASLVFDFSTPVGLDEFLVADIDWRNRGSISSRWRDVVEVTAVDAQGANVPLTAWVMNPDATTITVTGQVARASYGASGSDGGLDAADTNSQVAWSSNGQKIKTLRATYRVGVSGSGQQSVLIRNMKLDVEDDGDDEDGVDYDVDLDSDNDGIIDANEGCAKNTSIINGFGVGAISSSDNGAKIIEGTTATYNFIENNNNIEVLNLNGANQQGPVFKFNATSSSSSGEIDIQFSPAIHQPKFKFSDLDNDEVVTVILYDENNAIIDLFGGVNIAVGAQVTQSGTNGTIFTERGSENNLDGDSVDTDDLGSVIFNMYGYEVSRISVRVAHSTNTSVRFSQIEYCQGDTDNDGTPDYLDTDSDNDGCSDALEGADNILVANVQSNGQLDGAVNTTTGVPNNVNSTTGQGVGASNSNVTFDAFGQCDKDDDTIIDADDVCDGFDDRIDFDGDNIPNGCDVDDDNDGISDIQENNCLAQSGIFDWDQNFGSPNANQNNLQNSLPLTSQAVNGVTLQVTSQDPDGALNEISIVDSSGFGRGLEIENKNFTGNASTTILEFSEVVANLSFGVQDVDAFDFFHVDNLIIRVYNESDDVLILTTDNYTIGNHVKFLGANTFEGDPTQGNATLGDTGAVIQLVFTELVKKVELVFSNTDSAKNNFHRVTLSDINFNKVCDSDNDGFINSLDTDSDDDGCPDAVEAAGNIIDGLSTLSGGSPTANSSSQNLGTDAELATGKPLVNGVAFMQDNTTAVVTASDKTACTIDLSLVKTVNNALPKVGDNITYELTVTNSGFLNATGVEVSDVLPSGLTYVSNNAASGTTYNNTSGNWVIGDLSIGASVTLQITATITQAGVIVNTAEVSQSTQDDIDSEPDSGD